MSPQPQRIQLKRTKGWRKPEGAIVVSRPSKWGNPVSVAWLMEYDDVADRTDAYKVAADWFNAWLTESIRCEVTDVFLEQRRWILDHIAALAGHDLACWCPLGPPGVYVPCHADVLIALANDIPMEEVVRENTRRSGGETL